MRVPIAGFSPSRDGEIFADTSDVNQGISGSLAAGGIRGLARLRAANYLADAQVAAARGDANTSILNGAIGGLTSLGAGAFKAWKANAPTTGTGTPSAPQIDVANPTAGEKALMGATYKGWL